MGLKQLLQSSLNRFGYECRRRIEPLSWIASLDIGTVLDIGANEGQFSSSLRQLRPDVFIHCFEPNLEAAQALMSHFQGDPRTAIHTFGLGSLAGTATLRLNTFSPSSSLLRLASTHRQNFPHAMETSSVEIPIRRLDDCFGDFHVQGTTMLKLDVQGYELEVLDGGRNTLHECRYVYTEVSFIELYEGQPLFEEVLAFLGDKGFRPLGMYDVTYSRDTGACLFADILLEAR